MNSRTKNYRDFIRKFSLAKFPFKEIISSNNGFRKALFDEFVQTKQVADLFLYQRSFITEKEYYEGMLDAHNRIPARSSEGVIVAANHVNLTDFEVRVDKIKDDFNEHVYKRTLDKSFYSCDLESTDTFKILKEIENEFNSLQTRILNVADTLQHDRDADAYAHSIHLLLERLENPKLALAVSEAILRNDENIPLTVRMIFGEKIDASYGERYKLLKRHFDLHLSTRLKTLSSLVLDGSESNNKVDVAVANTDIRVNIFNPPMQLAEVEKWFVQLATNTSVNGKSFLTLEQVEQFIERAFEGKPNLEKLTLNMARGERTSITKLFYLYFDRCTQDYAIEPTKHCKEKYVHLLTDNFTNYNYKTVFDTFNNSKKAPKQWNTTI